MSSRALREEETLPHEYLRQAQVAASLRLLTGSDDYEVVCYTDNGEGELFLRRQNYLLMRGNALVSHAGDRLEWRTFSNYVD
jgi:hypothetical protein